MSHTSPATYLVWSILSCLLGAFLVFHLWSFDRFKCLRWNSGPYSGAFKRVMTYSYLLCVPLVAIYSLGFCVIKYRNGFTYMPGQGVMPTPYQLWPQSDQDVIFPLYLIFAIAWSLEMVTHLEELCFWLFLVNSGSTQQDWFRSLYFRAWTVGSIVAVLYMPLVTIFTRDGNDLLKCEAYTFLAGSLGSLTLTCSFTPILWKFPSFLQQLRNEGADMGTVARLTKFHELNVRPWLCLPFAISDTLRVIFRFMFVAPLLILAVDGIRPHQHLNESISQPIDVLSMLAGVGCTISSALTLVIFFPRQIETEIQVKDAKKSARTARSQGLTQSHSHSHSDDTVPKTAQTGRLHLLENHDEEVYGVSKPGFANPWDAEPANFKEDIILPPLSPNRRKPDPAPWDVEQGGGRLSERNLKKHDQRMSKYHRLVHSYTSPIGKSAGFPYALRTLMKAL
ncbi:hypothetical protein OE88DRAFT_1630947 [Heliocybe sulcata]|uniref:Uncharacterized protein n=1 Tax=Heliocybe sulcata TaxID=5364 RepID=A0A5C3N1F6_9AGAM|nr:hypothetical protein OE88DRAFT_1630947 [Heliocybe sulcata]